MKGVVSLFILLAVSFLGPLAADGQQSIDPFRTAAKDILAGEIGSRSTVQLVSSVHPRVRPEADLGAAPEDVMISRMTMVLRRSAAQQAALEALLAAQQDPQSPEYHKWLTPDEFGVYFGFSQGDLNKLTGWLRQKGFVVDEIPKGRWTIVFSGTAGQVRAAFQTEIHYYDVEGVRHRANATPLRIPEALSPVVDGVLGIHDFQPVSTVRRAAHPDFGDAVNHYLAPSDYAAIYNIAPLYAQGIDGTGQTIAIVSRCNIDVANVQAFRALTGLNPNITTVTIAAPPLPVQCSDGDLAEAYFDAEWSGAIAKGAKITLFAAYNLSDSASYIVNNNVAPVMNTSFGSCEADNQGGGNQFWSGLWQQASSHGITSLVSAGDTGAAGCDSAGSSFAVKGAGVNAICSTPYNVCVGGTEFNDFSNTFQFWQLGRATGYIPEQAWNESGSSGGSGLWATGGGFSTLYPKPAWQTGTGSSWRGVPDVSLAAAGHDGYFICADSSCNLSSFFYAYGTSLSTPSFAGLMALAVQKTGQRQGNANTALYALASRNNVFHDITAGNNSVPGQSGFTAGPGWDPVTGLGSVDANSMVTHWGPAGAPAVLLSSKTATFSNQATGAASSPQTVTLSNTGNAALNISAISVQGSNAADFPLTTNCPNSGALAAGQMCTLTITFKPAAAGAKTASISITDDAPGSPHTISLSGTAVNAAAPPTVLHSLTSEANGLASGSCSLPAQATTFTTASPAVWLYFDLSGMNVGDSVKMSFIRPDGVVYTNLTSTSNSNGYQCFSYNISVSGSPAVSYLGKWTVQAFWDQLAAPLFTVNFNLSAPSVGPVILASGVVNGASQADGLAPGGYITIYGTGLSTGGAQSWSVINDRLPTATAGTQVRINGKLAYVSYASPTQVNAIAPIDSAAGPVSVQVITAQGTSAAVTVNEKTVAPALFMFNQGSSHYAISTLPDGALVMPAGLLPPGTAARGAKAGEVISLWATGLGPTDPPYPDGQVVTPGNSGVLTSSYSVSIGGQPVEVDFAGLVGPGLYQINVHVPQLPPGDASVLVTVAGVSAQANANIYIGQ